MALQIIPILRALAPLVGASSSIVSSIAQRKRSGETLETDERLQQLENDVAATGKVLTSLAEQVQALAQELERRATRLEARERRCRWTFVISIVALLAGVSALGIVLVNG